ncbi:MAG: potassium channel family protein [Solirubrobacterales bacterium]
MANRKYRVSPPPLAPDRFRFLSLEPSPIWAIIRRILFALGLLLLVTMITYIGRDGYTDVEGDTPLTFIDALYYATVTITTTGYGDIVPSTQQSRLVTTLIVTPIRVLFLVLLVGTTLQVLADKSKFKFRVSRLQNGLRDHVVVCGFGVKGRSALEYLRNHLENVPAIAIDTSDESLEVANRMGIPGIAGSSFELEILRAAKIEKARTVVVSLDTDERSVLTVLRVRELNPGVKIVASCREEANVELLRKAGADEVIVSASSAGRILGMAAEAPDAARIVNDLLTFGDGLDINERVVTTAGESLERNRLETAIAVVRGNTVIRPGDARCLPLEVGDLVIYIDALEETFERPEALT